jgi:hypothetical protein
MHRIHCSYHKCLTIYYSRVMSQMYNRLLPWSGGYKHFNSHLDQFTENLGRWRVLSVNNHALDLDRLGSFRITHFVRDPRDLVVSGYHYHKRGAEPWCDVVNPAPERWKVVNGNIPAAMGGQHSYTTYLQSLPEEDGLIAEIEFRKHHFESMARWPKDHSDILTLRYEDTLGREVETFSRIFEFYGLPFHERALGRFLAWKYAAKRQSRRTAHIRNPEPAQWKKKFTPEVTRVFRERHGELIERYGYEW